MTEKNRGPYRKRMPRTCIVVGCGLFVCEIYAKGRYVEAGAHWARWRAKGRSATWKACGPRCGRSFGRKRGGFFNPLDTDASESGQEKHKKAVITRLPKSWGGRTLSSLPSGDPGTRNLVAPNSAWQKQNVVLN